MKNTALKTILALGLALIAGGGFAQDQANRDDRRQRDPEQMRAQMTERMKESLKVGDDEWQIIQPLLENVMTKQRESMSRGGARGAFGGTRGGRQGGNRPDANAATSTPDELDALRTALESEATSADDLKAKLAAVRKQRTTAQAELQKAREELRAVLTQRQEAQLVLTGILD